MHAATNTAPKADRRVVPWNKGKLIGQKPPLKMKEIWLSGFDCNLTIEPGNWRCSTPGWSPRPGTATGDR